MKTFAKITLLVAGLATAAAGLSVLNAADDSTPAAAAGKHPRLRALLARKAIRQRVAQRLGLTPDQISRLKATRASTAATLKAIRADTSLTTDEKKARARETLQAARTEMRGVLTAEQQARLARIRAAVRERLQARRAL